MVYLPIRKLEKILPNKSSELNKPVISDKEFCAIRAVICLLYESKNLGNNDELLEFYFKMFSCITTDTPKLLEDLSLIVEKSKSSLN